MKPIHNHTSSSGLTRGSRIKAHFWLDPRVKPEDDVVIWYKTLTGFLLQVLTIVIVLSLPAQAQIAVRPAPMWEGYEKTASDVQNDKDFVKQATELAGGDAAKAASSLIQIGWQRIGEGDPNHAVRAFNQAWLIQPDNPSVFWGFAIAAHIRNDDLDMVTRWFNRARQLIALRGLPENPRLEADEGRALAERGENEKAKSKFEKALSLDPKYVPAHIGMINVGEALGDEALKDKHQKIHDELVKE